MSDMNYLQLLGWVAPETIVLIGALAVLATDLLVLRDSSPGLRRLLLGLLASLACAVAMAWTIAMPQETVSFAQMLSLSPVSQVVKAAILLLAITTVLLSIDADFSPHCGEYLALVLMAAIGMMFLISSENLLLIFVSLEFTSLSLYILAGFDKSNPASAESALKYFLFGSMSAAFTLFGLSLLYGLSGSIYLPEIAAALHGPRLDPLLAVGLVMTVIGFGFKIAAVPFHLWAPDVYQGAPIPSAGFIASGSKVASFFVFAKVMWVGFAGVTGSGAPSAYLPGWVPMLALVAAVSILLGNLAAIVQTSVRRLLAYSAIAHAGYMLLGLLGTDTGMPSLLYYAITYGLTTVGAFGVVAVVQQQTGGDHVSDFAGLARREPLVAFCMLIFMLSLAGIPPLAGFFGKFYLFASALSGTKPAMSLLWLVILAIAFSAVSLYYYLVVLKQIYVRDAQPQPAARPSSPLTRLVLAFTAALVILLGCLPQPLLRQLTTAGSAHPKSPPQIVSLETHRQLAFNQDPSVCP